MTSHPRNIKYRENKRAWARDFLGGKCALCSSTDQLEFDHKDPKLKCFTVGGNMERSKAFLIPELKKCRLLCHKCHMDVTLLQRGLGRAKHGSPGMYVNYHCGCRVCKSGWAKYIRERYKAQSK